MRKEVKHTEHLKIPREAREKGLRVNDTNHGHTITGWIYENILYIESIQKNTASPSPTGS